MAGLGARRKPGAGRIRQGRLMAKDLTGAAVLFDLDGTLVDTADDLAASTNHALSRAGLGPVRPHEVRHLVGHGARSMLARGFEISAGRPASESELEAGLHVFLDHYASNIAVHSRPFEAAVETIERLRARGAGIAICTNKREAISRLLIETLRMTNLFDAIVGADTAAAPKPDAAPVRLCLEKTQARRGVFVGDSDTDIKAARAAGLSCLIAEFGYGPLALRNEAAAAFAHYNALEALIDETLAA